MNKNFFTFLLSLLFLPLLYIFVYINTEYLYQFDLLNSLTITYIIYFLIYIFILFISNKIKNNLIKSEIIYLGKFFLFFLILILPGIFLTHHFIAERIGDINLYLRAYGRVAFFYFALALVVSPLLNFIKKENIKENFILARKVFGILAFLFFLKHGLEYFSMEFIYQYTYNKDQSYLKYTYDNLLIRWDALSGILPGILMIILGVTSNKTSLKIFGGRFWKSIQSMVYPAFILSVVHIAFASRFDSFYIFLVGFVVIIRLMAYSIDKGKKVSGLTTKYKCIPCGYIYDEIAGDPDSGIAPGTRFEDIPDNWTCPICGVSKADFEPFYEGENTIFGGYMGEITGYNMLTEDVLELEIYIKENVNVIPGQYASLIIKDFDGEFTRSFSIVEQNGNKLKFAIKLKIDGRAGRRLKLMKVGEQIKIKGIYGNFTLKHISNPKVFIASGTGLAPMINMFKSNIYSDNNKLFFGVRAKSDVFYEELLRSFANLEVNIFLSKEEVEGYNYGRMDLSKYDFDISTEFYICGNPGLVAETFKFLEEKGYKNVYSEKFN